MNKIIINIVLGFAICTSTAVFAQSSQEPVSINWSSNDTTGEKITVPASDRPTVLLFARADQPQSKQAAKQVRDILQSLGQVQQILLLSGLQDMATAQKTAQMMQWSGPVVLDPEFTASGQMSIHVWPTTVVVNSSGKQVAHLAGLSSTYTRELDAYLAYASGKIDDATLKQKLTNDKVIADSEHQMASRHLQVAQKLLAKGSVDEARNEIEEGLKREPSSASLKVLMVRVMLLKGETKSAGEMIDSLDKSAIPAWQINQLRGKLLLAQGQTDAAIPLLQDALKLNPQPADIYYDLGKAYEAKSDWKAAATQYKAAFDAAR